MKTRCVAFACIGLELSALTGFSDTKTFDNYAELGSFASTGLYNLAGLGTWNGQPVTESNMPSDGNRTLLSTVNFFAQPTSKNILFVQVTNVATTFGASWFGIAFNNVTQTGVRVSFATMGNVSLGSPSFSNDFANPDETRAFGGATESTEPLTTTPGYGLTEGGQNQFLIQTINGADNGFTSLGGIHGASRIRGGGIFELTFGPDVDVFHDVDFASSTVESQYGTGNQYILAVPVPEPAFVTIVLVGACCFSLKIRPNAPKKH